MTAGGSQIRLGTQSPFPSRHGGARCPLVVRGEGDPRCRSRARATQTPSCGRRPTAGWCRSWARASTLCGRPKDAAWQHGSYLPSGAELASHLATRFSYPEGELLDLLRVSQYVEVTLGSGPLYDTLHQLFDADYPEPPARAAGQPAEAAGAGRRRRHQLIMTTNYDDALERAFRAAGEAFDLVWYVAETEDRGKFLHAGRGARLITGRTSTTTCPSRTGR